VVHPSSQGGLIWKKKSNSLDRDTLFVERYVDLHQSVQLPYLCEPNVKASIFSSIPLIGSTTLVDGRMTTFGGERVASRVRILKKHYGPVVYFTRTLRPIYNSAFS